MSIELPCAKTAAELTVLRGENDFLRKENAALKREVEELRAVVAGKTCFADPQAEERGARSLAIWLNSEGIAEIHDEHIEEWKQQKVRQNG